MRPHPARLSSQTVLIPLLCLWPLLQAQAQTTPPMPPAAPTMDCSHAAPPPPPPQAPPQPPAMREKHWQKALSLSAEQAQQLDRLLRQAHEQHQPPDEASLARLLNAEQRRRLRELLPPPPPAPPPAHPPTDLTHGPGAGCPAALTPAKPAQKPQPPAATASRPAG